MMLVQRCTQWTLFPSTPIVTCTISHPCTVLAPVCSPAARMSQLENAMNIIIEVFHEYSKKKGDKYKLNKKELKELLQNELGCFLKTQKDTEAVDKIMHDLDENDDGEVDFQEFMALLAALTIDSNTSFLEST